MPPRPRVLHVYKDYYPPVLGGIESTINLMARGTRDEFDVSVLVNSGSRQTLEEQIDGVAVSRIGEWRRFASAPISPGFPLALRQKAANADLIHMHHPNPTGDVAYLLAGVRKPTVMTYHSDVVRQKNMMLLYGPVQERMMRRCNVIMPTSPNYMESSPWLQRHRSRCRVLPLGIDLQRLKLDAEAAQWQADYRQQFGGGPIVAFVGRLRYYKGLEFLVRAMPKVGAKLLIGGTGNEASRLRELARQLGVTQKVLFLGDLEHAQLVGLLHAADVFCMPSHLRSEAFGLSQVEAMACGLPVVSTSIPSGVPFVNQDRVTGFSVPPENPEALAEALNGILSNDDLRQSMGLEARRRAEGLFSAEAMCSGLKQVYRDVLAGQCPTE